MPLPHFLMLVVAVVVAGMVTLMLALAAGVPLGVLALGLVSAALLVHVLMRTGRGIGSGPGITPGA